MNGHDADQIVFRGKNDRSVSWLSGARFPFRKEPTFLSVGPVIAWPLRTVTARLWPRRADDVAVRPRSQAACRTRYTSSTKSMV